MAHLIPGHVGWRPPAWVVVRQLLAACVLLRSGLGLSGLCRALPARLAARLWQSHTVCQTASCSSRQLQAAHYSHDR